MQRLRWVCSRMRLRCAGAGHMTESEGGASTFRTGRALRPYPVTVDMLDYLLTMDEYKLLLMFIAVSNLSLVKAQNVTTSAPDRLSESARLAAIIVPCVVGGIILIGIVAFIFIKIRERRRTEGTYRPSSEEHKEPRVEPNMALKLPPEERLI
ncbi:hypothetical protein XELAEV_18019125mg [Xenopus laevis]|nr:hypothetical protein XELAEV_18019125mg [Xenopus laevis]